MTYSLVIDNKQTIPCHEHTEVDIIFTASKLSKYGNCSVEVFKHDKFVCRYEQGRKKLNENIA